MSRRPPNPAAERAAKNQATIKSLLKLDPNKMCADCKRNKHPRWASWNLGVFICIRCSGIHRSMGVHISRVKSVDLDSWTDEQLQSVLKWGNARANKYWESKLAHGHVPSEAKIENFIRTKYELKRWVMDGPIPDPASLDVDGDDDVPLSIVKEKKNLEEKESLRKQSLGQSSAPAPQLDLIGGDDPIPRAASIAAPVAAKPPSKAEPTPPKATNTNSSLLGLDFFGSDLSPPPRPASTTATATGTAGLGGQSRPDLKQSILSLYATAPRQQSKQQVSYPTSTNTLVSMTSPTPQPQMSQQPTQPSGGTGGGLNDAFGTLTFSTLPSPKSSPTPAFSNLNAVSGSSRAATSQSQSQSQSQPQPQPQHTFAVPALGGGNFFASKPASTTPQHNQTPFNSGFDSIGHFASPAGPAKSPAPAPSTMNDFLDLSTPPPTSTPAAPASTAPISPTSAFNLSHSSKSLLAPVATSGPLSSISHSSIVSASDIWGKNAWADPAPTSKPPFTGALHTAKPMNDLDWTSHNSAFPSSVTASTNPSSALGGLVTQQKVAADEEFGGWMSSNGPSSTSGANTSKSLGGSEDLFSNVWQ